MARAARKKLRQLHVELLATASDAKAGPSAVHPRHLTGARNLLAYVALRHHDLRDLQQTLRSLGLSSLGRSEAAVVERIRATLAWLDLLIDETIPHAAPETCRVDSARARLDEHATILLGPAIAPRRSRILATVDRSIVGDAKLATALLESGVDCVRINASHDDETTWTRIVDTVRQASSGLGRDCRILVDLPGPKIRTGAVETGPAIVKVRPERDALGSVIEPGRLRLVPVGSSGSSDLPTVPVDERFVARLVRGEKVTIVDAREKERELRVESADGTSAVLLSDKTLYLVEGCPLTRSRSGRPETFVGPMTPLEGKIPLSVGDRLLITREARIGRLARFNRSGEIEPARIACTLPQALDPVGPGERVFLDDGHLGGVVRERRPEGLLVEITHAVRDVVRLREGKGINFPDTTLSFPALTDEDLALLPWVARHADIVGLSFTQSGDDVNRLVDALDQLGADDLGVVAKIETRAAFAQLPDILLASMRREACGVMIARGDLAVECGFERLAELQEEILWLAEAAHVPVIWATDVLASVARTGLPSRAEITDAAMGERAECVMLNKGPHQLTAVRLLDDILRRMESHQHKKSAMLRRLRSF